ncbi:dynamin family protein [Allochromatium humboldtianum]|uniref:Dynamin family protein n=1 Tax=Allochromatium humboldtianum TaxID=504901 RepID=A0A850RF09_9GAMM|nr:GTPase [Allochromatium humboldtianum]NVZ08241.1 dynamin family protein [Allochromatium humboldtianum]
MMTASALEFVLDALRPLLQASLPQRLDTLDTLRQALHDRRSRLLVFGAYNAGKSTLVNALLGREEAPVGDIPTTLRTAEYDWGRRILLDTPGVNAPVEHESVAAETLRTAQRILFVVREGNQDCADVYDRLFELLGERRPVILLINHQYAKIEEAEALRARLLDVLLTQAARREVPDAHIAALPVLLLNARLALRGRLESSAVFVRESGLEDVGTRLEQWLEACEREHPPVAQIQADIKRELLQPLLASLKANGAPQEALTRSAEDLAQLEQRLRWLTERTQNRLATMIYPLQPQIGAALDQSQGQVDVLQARLAELAAGVAEDMAGWLEAELVPLYAEANRLVDRLRTTRVTADPASHAEYDLTKDILESVGKLTLTGVRAIRKEHLLELLKAGRAAKIPWLKGRWETTLEKWAGKAMPWIQAGVAVLEIGLAQYGQHQHNTERQRAALQRQQWIEEIASALIAAIQDAAMQALAEVETQIVLPLRQQHEAQVQAADGHQQTILQVKTWLAMCAPSMPEPVS